MMPSAPSCIWYLVVQHDKRYGYYDVYCPSCKSFDPPELHKGPQSRKKCHHWGCYCNECTTTYTNVMRWLAHRARACKIVVEKWHQNGVFD
eukprot:UN02262